jgi:hypothetical protein
MLAIPVDLWSDSHRLWIIVCPLKAFKMQCASSSIRKRREAWPRKKQKRIFASFVTQQRNSLEQLSRVSATKVERRE